MLESNTELIKILDLLFKKLLKTLYMLAKTLLFLLHVWK